jgi:hypothetical protein
MPKSLQNKSTKKAAKFCQKRGANKSQKGPKLTAPHPKRAKKLNKTGAKQATTYLRKTRNDLASPLYIEDDCGREVD